ncbi:hypothetical protein H6F90_21925 [Trichocoleus sp. FACHB-591]|uniref:hypothetical protein n=1 Tax=Trichocoleus sp. FACHB-591 TaxID=2692872 RepID=UPI0016849743|nr:hypothetical protein [Trichocoleus sp. FACHB-591]MBD2097735.1 hypothetical protein [Trichocoleus sp. FACHB-591]
MFTSVAAALFEVSDNSSLSLNHYLFSNAAVVAMMLALKGAIAQLYGSARTSSNPLAIVLRRCLILLLQSA